MKFLFVHQNFPGQFVHLAASLAADHQVVALGCPGRPVKGVRLVSYPFAIDRSQQSSEWTNPFEEQVSRGTACAAAMQRMQRDGFEPDVIVGHPGWGEMLFCRDIWPRAKLIVFAEFFYGTPGSDYAFDPEFTTDTQVARTRVRLKNTVHLHALHAADAGYSPTQWQHSRLPPEFRDKVQVLFDGVRTDVVRPSDDVSVLLRRQNLRLTSGSEVVTFVNRNLEPYRGFHTFMRALPRILARRPSAHCVLVGNDGVSYGSAPAGGGTWKQRMLKEVGSSLPMDRIHFVSKIDYENYVRVLQVSACHVYLTYPFVLSWSCVEAMSAGCIVVGSDTAPVREVIAHNETGLLVDFFDVEGLADRVVDVLSDRERYRPLGLAARAQAARRYDLQAVCLPALRRFVLA